MARRVDVYLFPAVVGGGFGDIEEVLAAGRRLSRAGFRTILYRQPGHPLPPAVDGPWAWPRLERSDRLDPRGGAAMTVVPAWGVSAAPERPGPFGRAGPWAAEASDVERAYGPDRTLHVSLEEFARTLTSREENLERLREGGVRSRQLPARLAKARTLGEVTTFDRAFRTFRAFDRPNVLHVFATFRRSARFAREFPEAVQTGPLWPARYRRAARCRTTRSPKWFWYASPSSAEGIAPLVAEGLVATRPPVRLYVRTPRPWRTPFDPDRVEVDTGRLEEGAWRRRFADADLRIVTGSRTLLEALEVGGPFLYFNGTLGAGAGRRRHRPEKIAALLELGQGAGVAGRPPPRPRRLRAGPPDPGDRLAGGPAKGGLGPLSRDPRAVGVSGGPTATRANFWYASPGDLRRPGRMRRRRSPSSGGVQTFKQTPSLKRAHAGGPCHPSGRCPGSGRERPVPPTRGASRAS